MCTLVDTATTSVTTPLDLVAANPAGPVAASITAKLEAAFKPDVLDVVNESASHNVPRGSESHFKVVLVAHAFASVPLLERHRLVNRVGRRRGRQIRHNPLLSGDTCAMTKAARMRVFSTVGTSG